MAETPTREDESSLNIDLSFMRKHLDLPCDAKKRSNKKVLKMCKNKQQQLEREMHGLISNANKIFQPEFLTKLVQIELAR